MTIYAKQVPPEYQISTFDYANYENIILTGNRNYMEYWPKWAENIGSYMEDALSALYYIQSGRGYYDSWEDVLADLLTPHGRDAYTREERKKWVSILETYADADNRQQNNTICAALSLMTGTVWDWCDLHGTCQGEWIECFYIEDMWNREHLEVLESEYFNTGTQWHITEGDNDPGYYQYCTGWNNDSIRKEIAETSGANPNEIILYEFKGWNKTAEYQEVGA